MTLPYLKTGLIAALLASGLGTAAFILPASAMAGETTPQTIATATEFQVSTASDGLIRSGVKAFEKGDFAKSVSLNKAVIRIRPSKRKTAVAQSNLCASWAMLGDMTKAEIACDAALKLRPDYAPAQSNKALIRVKLAQK